MWREKVLYYKVAFNINKLFKYICLSIKEKCWNQRKKKDKFSISCFNFSRKKYVYVDNLPQNTDAVMEDLSVIFPTAKQYCYQMLCGWRHQMSLGICIFTFFHNMTDK